MYMKINKTLKFFLKPERIVIAVLLIAFLIFGVKTCTYNNKLQDSLAIALQEKAELQKFSNMRGDTIVAQQAIISSDQDELLALSQEKFQLKRENARLVKKVLAFSSQTTETKIPDSVFVPYVDTTGHKKFQDSIARQCAEVIQYINDSTIRVPVTAKDSTEHYNINLTVERTGVKINTVSIPDSVYFRIIEKKGGFFRKVNGKLKFHVPKTIEFQTLHTNPLVHVTGQTSIYYTPHKKLNWLGKGLLLGAGVYIGTRL